MAFIDYSEILTRITIDHMSFHVTRNPFERESCVLWYMDQLSHTAYTALGKFSRFDKRKVLEFVTRYATNPSLREELAKRQFYRKIETITISYFEEIERLTSQDKEQAYRDLFNLDASIHRDDLTARRRLMAKKFHPDRGGDTRAMSLINEAYDYLVTRAR